MTDIEKVITALELCRYDHDPGQELKHIHSCAKCPYHDPQAPMCAFMYTDAISLLKRLIPVSAEIEGDKGTWWYACGKCHTAINHMDNFCRECGRRLRWT